MGKNQRKCNANPATQRPFCTSKWFVKAPSSNKYVPRGGNQIQLLNCGDEYLPELYNAINNATKTIYIAIWGFNPHVSLKLNSTDPAHKMGNVLQRKAEGGVKVKILVWYHWFANIGSASAGDSSLHKEYWAWFLSSDWNLMARIGRIKNIEFITRDPDSTALSPKTLEEMVKKREEMSAVWKRGKQSTRGRRLSPDDRAEFNRLVNEFNQLKKVGYGAHTAQQERIGNGIPYGNIGKFPTHHQKTVLIDHSVPGKEIGFVQGFNFWPKYFDESHHPYRGINNRIQDVGLLLKGSCLIDIYHNFAQSWNEEKKGTPVSPQAPQIASRGVGGYTCQILRTWRMQDEFNIHAFYQKAFTKLNQFIYVEDQYFRQPEFAKALQARAKQIREKAGGKKQLHVFAVTNLNEAAIGEINVREGMLNELNRSDLKASEAQFKKRQEDDKAREKIKAEMEKVGVMVHVCRLRNSQVKGRKKPGGHAGRGWKPVRYGDTYIHSKLTIFDDAYLTLGSANWNHRSMFTDTELNIAMQSHDHAAANFRQKIWAAHTNGLWKDKKKDGSKTNAKHWYKQWDDMLRKNFFAYTDDKPLLMNLFPYYEDIDVVREKGVILEMKQKAT